MRKIINNSARIACYVSLFGIVGWLHDMWDMIIDGKILRF